MVNVYAPFQAIKAALAGRSFVHVAQLLVNIAKPQPDTPESE